MKRFRARLGSRWHLADDLAQDTWVQVAKSLPKFRGTDDRAFTWLCVIAQRVTADHFRLARHTREVATDFTGPAGSLQLAPAAEDIAIERITALTDPAAAMPTDVCPVCEYWKCRCGTSVSGVAA
ncbi:RNA polymerase sigma factor [Streptomyces niveus]|uniref:RNA polymerase sigma factor n=1 Tax=Streptomyces niveus TaxID=193462 RepID=UPI0035D654E6